MTAYELLQRGYWHLYRGTSEERIIARRYFEAAAECDPSYACALAALAGVKFRDAGADVVHGFRNGMEDCRATAEQALALDPRHPFALRFLSGAASYLDEQERALAAANRAVELCPSFATAYSALAFAHNYLGNFADARPAADETARLRPHDPVLHKCIISKAIADYQTGDYPNAELTILESLRTNRNWWMSNMMLAATAAQRGSIDSASAAMGRIREDQPGITLEIMLDRVPFADAIHRDHLADGLKRAGWRDDR
jgi:adenylate cyclase